MQTLLNNLQDSHTDSYLVCHCRDFFTTFEECVNYLKKEAVRRADVAGRVGTRRAKRTSAVRSSMSNSPSMMSEVTIEEVIEVRKPVIWYDNLKWIIVLYLTVQTLRRP